MLALARTDRSIVVSVKQLDLHPRLLACRNGTVDLRTGELVPANPADLITRGVELKFDPSARSDAWESFLRQIFSGDDELICYVQRLAGYAITGEVGEHVLPIFHGTGANGKSTFVTAIQNVMGEHAIVGPKGLLVEQRHEAHEERLAVLRGRRLVVSSELEHRAVLAESLVKTMTGGDKMSARHLYKDRFDFEPQFTIVLVTNYPPRVAGTDEAIWRRLRLVPFNHVIPMGDRIPDYGQLLAKRDGEAMLAWLVQGAVEHYHAGLGESQQVITATANYRQHEDIFGQWLDERTTTIAGRSKVAHLRDDWCRWADAAGISHGRTQDFSDWLESHGSELTRYQGAKFAQGIGLLAQDAGQTAAVRSGEGSSVTFLYADASRGSYGTDLTRPHGTQVNTVLCKAEPPLGEQDLARMFDADEWDD
jgi:putative DNA primase/helicase